MFLIYSLIAFSWPALMMPEHSPFFLFIVVVYLGMYLSTWLMAPYIGVLVGSSADLRAELEGNITVTRPKPALATLSYLLMFQASVFLAVYSQRVDWAAGKAFFGQVAHLMSAVVPALQSLHQDMAAAGQLARFETVRDAASIGYLFGLLVFCFWLLIPAPQSSEPFKLFKQFFERMNGLSSVIIGTIGVLVFPVAQLWNVNVTPDQFALFTATDLDLVCFIWLVSLIFYSTAGLGVRVSLMALKGRFSDELDGV